MRLVDATDIEKFIRENVCAIGDDHLLLVAGNDGRWHEALTFIETAYDIDKVVEELESEKRYGSKYDSYYEENLYRGEMFENDVNNKTIDKAIEIVKHGVVTDDCCEWKLEDEEANLYLTECQQRQLIFEGTPKENGYRYCPYCGKKIKAVE